MSDIIKINGTNRILSIDEYNIWGGGTEYVIKLTGYLVPNSHGEIKALYGGEKTYNRFLHDKNEANPFKKLGGYALNKINLDELIFIERFNFFVDKSHLFLVNGLELSDFKQTIWIKHIGKNIDYRIGYKQFTIDEKN